MTGAGVERVRLHSQGPEMSRLIWGSMRAFDHFATPAKLADFLGFLLDQGVTTVDTADIYGKYGVEAHLGAALKLMGVRARRFEIITKADICLATENRPRHRMKHYNASAAHMTAALDASLRNLGVEAVDLWLVHRPDPLMDAEETAGALDRAVAAGKAHHVGVSNFRPSQIELLASRLKAPIVTDQIEFSPLQLDPLSDGTLDIVQRLAIRPQIWSPVAGGRLLSGTGEREVHVREILSRVAGELGLAGPAEAALAWVARHPSRPLPIIGSGRKERIEGALAALAVRMDEQTWYEIWRASLGSPVP